MKTALLPPALEEDPQQRRTGAGVGHQAGHLTGKYGVGGNPIWETAWLGDLPAAALTPPAGRFYIAPDHQGSPHQITAAGGAPAWLWLHDPFGNGDALGGPYDLRFPGQYFDQATKLHYNYFRDYDPRLSRYIESDPIGLAGGINTYAYVGGNPVSGVDPLGLTDGFSQAIGGIINSILDKLCPCPACTPYPAGTIGWTRLDTTHDHHPIEGAHLHLRQVNQRPSDCKCFWNDANPDVASPPPQPDWVDLTGGEPPLTP